MINSRELMRKNYECENCLNTETQLINPIEVNLICNECDGILSEINDSEIKFLKKKKKPSDNNNLNESKIKDGKKSKDKKTKNERKTLIENNNNNQRNNGMNVNLNNQSNNTNTHNNDGLNLENFPSFNTDLFEPINDFFFDAFVQTEPMLFELPIIIPDLNINHPTSNSILKKLKKFSMDDKYCKKDSNGKLEFPNCCICITDIQKKEKTVLLPCGHMFHWKCCLKWLKNNNICPVCRFKLSTNN